MKYGEIITPKQKDKAKIGKTYVFCDDAFKLLAIRLGVYDMPYRSLVRGVLTSVVYNSISLFADFPFRRDDKTYYKYILEVLEDDEETKETKHNTEPVEDDWPILSAETADKAVIGQKYYMSDDIEALKRIKSGGECTCSCGTLTGVNEYPFSKGGSLFAFKYALEVRNMKPEETEKEKDKVSIRHFYRPFESIAELKDEYNKLNGYLRGSKPLIWIRREEDNTEEPILSYDYNETTVSTLNYDMSLQELFDTCLFVISGKDEEEACGVRR